MQRWVYYDYMGKLNPVCEDAGEITKINTNPGEPYTYSNVLSVVADGRVIYCDTKPSAMKHGGFVLFEPQSKEGEYIGAKKFPAVKHGTEIKMDPRFSFSDKIMPICTDPRILYIAHRAALLGLEPSKEELEQLAADIPTRQEALRYLIKVGAKYDCIPPECINRE